MHVIGRSSSERSILVTVQNSIDIYDKFLGAILGNEKTIYQLKSE